MKYLKLDDLLLLLGVFELLFPEVLGLVGVTTFDEPDWLVLA